MKILLALISLAALPVLGADHIITWNANPPEQNVTIYSVYRQVGTNWTLIATTDTNTVTILGVLPGWHTYAITARNAIGESERSLPASAFVPALPTPPTNIIVNLRAEIQSSDRPGAPWREFAVISIPMETPSQESYFRARLDWQNSGGIATAKRAVPSAPQLGLPPLPAPLIR